MHQYKMKWIMLLLIVMAYSARMIFDPSAPAPHIQSTYARSWMERAVTERMVYRSTGAITVQFTGTPPSVGVQNAIFYAAQLMNLFFACSHPIILAVSWSDLSGLNPNLLGEGGSIAQCLHPDSVDYPYVLIPAALYTELTGSVNCPGVGVSYHASISLNSNPPAPWFIGTSGLVPSTYLDLITVTLHEMMHGMGFESFMNSDGTVGSAPYGYLYDWFLFRSTSNGWPSSFTDPIGTPALTNSGVLTSSVFFNGTTMADGITSFAVYTPSTFLIGTSIGHVNPSSDSINRLMFPSIGHGHAWHNIGANVWVAMSSMGYTMHPYVDVYDATTLSVASISDANSLQSFFNCK